MTCNCKSKRDCSCNCNNTTIFKNYTVPVEGGNGATPYIGINNNWWVDGVDTGVSALGQEGETPYIGVNGNWWIDTVDTGVSATGNSVVFRYAVNQSDTTPPAITNVINPSGWQDSPQTITYGDYRWVVTGFKNNVSGELVGVWSNPSIDGFIAELAPENDDDVFDI